MRAAYIISAYKRPDLLIRLVKALPDAPVAIHIDLKSDIFGQVKAHLGSLPNVTFLPRHVCHWGLIGHVKASLEGLNWFIGTDCDYAILLTGQCYPLKSLSEIQAELTNLNGRSVIEHAPFPRPEWEGHDRGGYTRADRFYFHLRPKVGRGYWRLDPFVLRFSNGVRLLRMKLWNRKPPYGLRLYGGSGYWCLSRSAVSLVLRETRKRPRILKYFSSTFVPDEMFFQTLLANSDELAHLINSPIHFLDWSRGGANPAVISVANLDVAFKSGAWFARKFEDHDVLDMVDQMRASTDEIHQSPPWERPGAV